MTMTKHRTGTREEWLKARIDLLDAEKALTRRGIEYNYRREKPLDVPLEERAPDAGAVLFARMSGTDAATYTRERPGMSAFVLDEGIVYHAYSAYARGLDGLWGMYQWLDRAPKGRNEIGPWWRRHDEYERKAVIK